MQRKKRRDSYKFFRWLNSKFNGDLFPGKGATEEKRETEWQTEEQKVKETHLNILADFVSGHIDIETGQLSLWTYYRFDVIPLEFISGNAPWGRNTVTPAAQSWAGDVWTITYGNIGPLFLPKAATLTKSGGQVAMMQPAMALIFNQVGTAQEFRARLFSEFKIEEIVNLSALRFGLFKDAISPACIITMSTMPPDGEPLTYICPKPVMTNEDDYHIVIEPDYINTIYPQEAIGDPLSIAFKWFIFWIYP